MNHFCFTVDDNIRVFKELTEGNYASVFEHPYLALYERLHRRYGLKVQLNLFYETDGFDLSMMTDRYRAEWSQNSHWLKMSFHSQKENVLPYKNAGYEAVYADCSRVQREVSRFAGNEVLATTTTIHYCQCTQDGVRALSDNGVCGLLGLFGTNAEPRTSYSIGEHEAECLRNGELLSIGGMYYSAIDLILNLYSTEEIEEKLHGLLGRNLIKIMIHEQYFYADYGGYQANFADKVEAAVRMLTESGYCSCFFEKSFSDL